MGNYTIFLVFENSRRGRQARILTTNVPKILDLKFVFRLPNRCFPKIVVGCPWDLTLVLGIYHVFGRSIWFKQVMMLCPLNVGLKLNRFVNMTCSFFNIRGGYFNARYFFNTIVFIIRFFTNQLTGHNIMYAVKYKFTSSFFFFVDIHFQNPWKNSEHYTCRPRHSWPIAWLA